MIEELKILCSGLPLTPLPENFGPTPNIAHAAKKNIVLNPEEKKVIYLFNS